MSDMVAEQRRRTCKQLWLLLALHFFRCGYASSTAAAAPTTSASNVLLLDDYGNAVQLQHARNAAQQQGSLVVVLDRPNGELWVVSLVMGGDVNDDNEDQPKSSHLRRRRPSEEEKEDEIDQSHPRIGHIDRGPHRFLQPLVNSFSHSFGNDDDSLNSQHNRVALVCVGVQADAVWFMGMLQEYTTLLWERTDVSNIGLPAVLQAASALMQHCATRYPQVSGAYGATLESLLQQEEEKHKNQQSTPWSRPLGLCSFVLDLRSVSSSVSPELVTKERQPHMFQLDPSGLIQPIRSRMACLGKYSSELEYWWQTHVEDNNNKKNDEDEVGQQELSDRDVCQRLHQGLSHILSQVPPALRLEIWSPVTRTIQRRIVSFDRDLSV